MAIHLLPGTSNVVRFPIEERARATLDLMRELAPYVRAVELAAEAFDLPLPALDFRHRVDAEAAEHILNNIDDAHGPKRDAELHALLDPLVNGAVSAARSWRRAAREAEAVAARAAAAGSYRAEQLELQHEAMQRKAAELLVEAYIRSEEAEGVARAVSLARSGQVWMPFDLQADAAALFGLPASLHG